jgi:hypothetical protein
VSHELGSRARRDYPRSGPQPLFETGSKKLGQPRCAGTKAKRAATKGGTPPALLSRRVLRRIGALCLLAAGSVGPASQGGVTGFWAGAAVEARLVPQDRPSVPQKRPSPQPSDGAILGPCIPQVGALRKGLPARRFCRLSANKRISCLPTSGARWQGRKPHGPTLRFGRVAQD